MAPLSTAYACRISVTARFLFFRSEFWHGQAFAIDEYRLLTNHHVVGHASRNVNSLRLNGVKLHVKRIITAREAIGTNDDLAIIECAGPHGIPVPPIAAVAPTKGSALQYINQDGRRLKARLHCQAGHQTLFNVLEEAGLIDYEDEGFVTGRDDLKKARLDKTSMYHTGLRCRHGDSGSAAYNAEGEVIGVIFAIHKVTRQSLVVPYEVMQSFIAAVTK